MTMFRKLFASLQLTLLALTCASAFSANTIDTFVRANETPLSSPWVADTTGSQQGIRLLSNAAAAGPTGANRSLSYRSDSSATYSAVRYKTVSATNNDSGPLICGDGGTDQFYYGALYWTGSFYTAYIGRRTSGAWTDVFAPNTNVGFTPAVGDWLALYRSGNNVVIAIYRASAWTVLGSANDTTYMSGADGMRIGGGTPLDDTTFDRWANYDTFATATPSTGILLQQFTALQPINDSNYLLVSNGTN